MNIKEAKQEIKNTIAAYLRKDDLGEYQIPEIRQRPILLIGPPGVGKTQIMEQVTRECKIGFVSYTITHHTRQSAVGLPFIRQEVYEGKEYAVTEYTMSEIISSIYKEMKKTGKKEGILFIDEINCVSETLAPTMLQFLQCKTFGNQAVPKGWIIVAAGNPPEYNKSVREFDVVTLDRVRQITIEADDKVWKEYAREVGIHRAVTGYLELHPKNFYRIEKDVDGMHFVTARGWEDFSHLLYSYRSLQFPVTEEVIYEYLPHREVAEDFSAYLDLYVKYEEEYPVGKIISGVVDPVIYERLSRAAFDERITVTELVLNALFQKIQEYRFEKRLTDAWFTFLKKYRSQVEQAEDKRQCYLDLLLQETEAFAKAKEAGDVIKKEEAFHMILLRFFKSSIPQNGKEAKPCFEEAKEGFVKKKEEMERKKAQAEDALEHAFTFMEDAFNTGEEMILFVTELTISPDSALFLAEYPCERYLKYSRELLIGTRRQELLSELNSAVRSSYTH